MFIHEALTAPASPPGMDQEKNTNKNFENLI